MGKKPSSKQSPPAAPGREGHRAGQKGIGPLIWVAALVAVVAVGAFALRPQPEASASAATPSAEMPATSTDTAAQTPAAASAPPTPETIAKAEALAKFGPRRQQNLPPIPFRGYAPPRPPEVVTAAYQFAAEHPEILSYIPCFCGCENAGHSGNHDCFVKARAANGDVTEWDEHGVECTVCIDVANRSRQMHASGASVRDIRSAIEREFGPVYPGRTPTPAPHSASHDD